MQQYQDDSQSQCEGYLSVLQIVVSQDFELKWQCNPKLSVVPRGC